MAAPADEGLGSPYCWEPCCGNGANRPSPPDSPTCDASELSTTGPANDAGTSVVCPAPISTEAMPPRPNPKLPLRPKPLSLRPGGCGPRRWASEAVRRLTTESSRSAPRMSRRLPAIGSRAAVWALMAAAAALPPHMLLPRLAAPVPPIAPTIRS